MAKKDAKKDRERERQRESTGDTHRYMARLQSKDLEHGTTIHQRDASSHGHRQRQQLWRLMDTSTLERAT